MLQSLDVPGVDVPVPHLRELRRRAGPRRSGILDIEKDATSTPLGPTARNGRLDTCWIANTEDGKFAFATNAMSGDFSSYRVGTDGTLVLLGLIAATVRPITADTALSGGSRYLYARSASDGAISVFRVENDGAPTRLQDIGGFRPAVAQSASPPGKVGLLQAARVVLCV